MPKWLRMVTSGLIASLVFGATYPSTITVHGGSYVSCVAFTPFILVWISARRSPTWERIGWCAHGATFAAALFG
jgi:hypothetical protein